MLDLAVAVPSLVGSIVSTFAIGSIFICYLVAPPHHHFRHTLILNLAAANFLNAMNSSISGSYAMAHYYIPAGGACKINGLIGQLTGQGIDFSILFISIATVLNLMKSNFKPKSGLKLKLLVTIGIWFVPLCTSITGFILDNYQPVSGSWCWLSSDAPGLRYALVHGWRLAIILTIISLYAYLFIHIHRHLSNQKVISSYNGHPRAGRIEHWSDNTHPVTRDIRKTYANDDFKVYDESNDWCWNSTTDDEASNETSKFERNDYFTKFPSHPNDIGILSLKNNIRQSASSSLSPIKIIKQIFYPSRLEVSTSTKYSPHVLRRETYEPPFLTRDPLALVQITPSHKVIISIESFRPIPPCNVGGRELHIQRMLLFNTYPVAYVLLWIPGIVNQFIELSGNKSRTMAIAQTSTQFVGLANALVYGYNERIWNQAKQWWARKRQSHYEAQKNDKMRDSLARMEISWPISR